jgi:cation-transporting ATPase 13A1
MEGTNKMRAQLEYAFSDINNPDRPPEKLSWFDWMNMDIEEHAELKKKEKIQNVLDSLPKHMRVPKKYMPEFVPMLLLGILGVLHALIMLMQHWNVKFNVWLNYTLVDIDQMEIPQDMMEIPADIESNVKGDGKVVGGKTLGELVYEAAETKPIPGNLPTHAMIYAEGKHLLLPLLYLPTLGLTFEYHRRRYTFTEATDEWTKIRCKTDMPTEFFKKWSGFTEVTQITASEIRYGKNEFNVRQPTFKDLYKAQLLSPFTVFQLFCVLLWVLDSYWQYSFFSLFMILMFEATVVFSRIKSLSALKGMGNKSRNVWVFRMGEWVEVDSCELLPGDIISLTRLAPHYTKGENGKNKLEMENEGGDVVPADLLLLKGSAVVNEASLTGESVPQVKDGLVDMSEEQLSMKTGHKTHVLYAGTKMLQCKGVGEIEAEEESSDEEDGNVHSSGGKMYSSIPKAPDSGALCFVLRTGFLSAQGKLVRMIEGSQEKVKGHEKETGLLLLLLFFFALVSSGYVLYHSYGKENRSQYELLLHCILIITSVIPPELPMQMALAVNNSLMTLMKMQVFCTEPYRVPIAGKLDACLFDKTGTLTTDELVAVGVCRANVVETGTKIVKDKSILTPMTKINDEAALVLAGCHSLVLIEGQMTGDPLEIAALKSMRWFIHESSGHAIPKPATEKKEGGLTISMPDGSNISDLEVLARHHFSSKLQRMSCVVRDTKSRKVYAVVKGSPEAIGKLLARKPTGFENVAKNLAKSGYRVIALGYKILSGSDVIEAAKDSRSACEENIKCAGFIAFTCRVRRDTQMVLARLMEGGMSVAMVTGDALLTAAHVAKEVGICDNENEEEIIDMRDIPFEQNEELRNLLVERKKSQVGYKPPKKKTIKPILILEKSNSGTMYWQSYDDDTKVEEYSAARVQELSKKYDFAVTGQNLQSAFEFDEETKKVLGYFKIFARMTPDAKETVIQCLHSVGALCLMCGDGANDVGALKQADVGVALLSGFGDVNVDKGEDGKKKKDSGIKDDEALPPGATIPPDQLEAMKRVPTMVIKAKVRQLGIDPNKYSVLTTHEDWIKLYQIKLKEKAIFEHKKKMALADQKSKKNDLFAEKQQKLAKRVAELEAQGVQFAQWKAMKEFMAEEKEAAKKTKAEMAKLGGVEGQAANLTAQLEDLELDEIPMVKLGDASIAAPFTSKMPSIRSCVDIIRQGRCTLVTSLQMVCLFQLFIVSLLYILPLVSHMRVAPPSILLVPNTCVKLHDQFLLAVGTLFRRGQVRRRPNDCHGYAHDRVIHNRI